MKGTHQRRGKNWSQEPSETFTLISRQETAESYEKQMSQEDTLWQNDQRDVIWLELQAWFAGKDRWCQDQWIHHERSLLEEVATTVTSYSFQPCQRQLLQQVSVESSAEISAAHDVYYDAQESIESRLSEADISSQLDNLNINEDSNDTLVSERQDTLTEEVDGIVFSSELSEAGSVTEKENLCDSLDVWCERRVAITEQALGEVEELLKKIDRCERLFPSRRRLQEDNELWREEEFSARVKVLCMWYNITVQLHQKTRQLGHVLVGLGARQVPWPSVTTADKGTLTEQEASKAPTPAVEERLQLDVQDLKKSPVKVRFQVSEDTASTSSPSDSNNSDSSSLALQSSNRLLGLGPKRYIYKILLA